MITLVGFVVAAALGALGRAEAGRRWNHGRFSVGTLVVNVTGSFALGLLVDVAPPTLTVLGVGGLGAFTTFSSFAGDAAALGERRQIGAALVYVTLSVALGVAGAWFAMAIAG